MIVGIIPSYMPDEKLAQTVAGCLQTCGNIQRLVVVDDGSGSAFAEVFDRVGAMDDRVEVLHLGVNIGTGGALKAGMQHAIYKYPKAVGLVAFDADGQHHPEDVRNVVDRFLENPDAFVIGVREYHDPSIDIPLRSRFGNRVTEVVFRLCTGVHLKDTQSGLRCYSRKLAALCTQIEKCRYEFQLEALILAVESATCVQVPIRTIYEENNRRSHFRPVLDSLRIYSVFFRFLASSLISFAVDYVVFSVAYLLLEPMACRAILYSLIVSRVCSCSVNFLINKFSVFRSRGETVREAVSFVALALMLFVLSYCGIWFMKEHMHVSPLISKILVEATLFVTSFAVQRFYVFVRR